MIDFRSGDWHDWIKTGFNSAQFEKQIITADGIQSTGPYRVDRFARIAGDVDIDADMRATVIIDSEKVDINVKVVGLYVVRYDVDAQLNSEDAAEAEQNLLAAIKAGEEDFKIHTTARVDWNKPTKIYIDWAQISTADGRDLVDEEKAKEIVRAAMNGETTELGDFSFISEHIPHPTDQRIELIQKVPEDMIQVGNHVSEELMTKGNDKMTKFQIENWREYYNAKLDEEDLLGQIEDACEGESAAISLSGDKLVTKVTHELDGYIIMAEYVDDETGDEDEIELEISGDIKYTAEYKVDSEDVNLSAVEEALAEAIEAGRSTFEVEVYADLVSVSDVSIDQVDCYDLDEYDERKIYNLALKEITNDLNDSAYYPNSQAGDSLNPTRKELKFICTIPAE